MEKVATKRWRRQTMMALTSRDDGKDRRGPKQRVPAILYTSVPEDGWLGSDDVTGTEWPRHVDGCSDVEGVNVTVMHPPVPEHILAHSILVSSWASKRRLLVYRTSSTAEGSLAKVYIFTSADTRYKCTWTRMVTTVQIIVIHSVKTCISLKFSHHSFPVVIVYRIKRAAGATSCHGVLLMLFFFFLNINLLLLFCHYTICSSCV